jgi:hypothetical protein
LSTWLQQSGAPQVSPNPVITLSTGVRPASKHNAGRSADRGVSSAGFRTTVHGGQHRAQFPAAINNGKFHGMICATTPSVPCAYKRGTAHLRIGHGDGDGVAFDLGCPACHVVEQIRSQGYVGSPRHSNGLAVVERFQLREFLKILENQIADFPQNLAARRR